MDWTGPTACGTSKYSRGPSSRKGRVVSADAPRARHGARRTGQHERETRLAALGGCAAAAVVVVPDLLLVADVRAGADDGTADACAAPDPASVEQERVLDLGADVDQDAAPDDRPDHRAAADDGA